MLPNQSLQPTLLRNAVEIYSLALINSPCSADHMKTIPLLGVAIVATIITGTAAAEIKIRDYPPGVLVDGGTVPTEAIFTPPLTAGQTVIIEATGTEALRLDVIEGEVSKLSSRLKMAEAGSITYRKLRDGKLEETSVITVQIKNGVRPTGTASLAVKGDKDLRERRKVGSYGMLVFTENGMGSVIVLHDSGFRVRIVGSNALSNGLFLGVEGGFSDEVVSEFSKP